MTNGSMVLKKATSLPKKRYDIAVAVTVDINRGSIDVIEMLKRRISNVKRIPAIGALKIPATAPAAPQPKRIVICLYERPSTLAIFEPMAAPV